MGRRNDTIFTTVKFSDKPTKTTTEEAETVLMNFFKYLLFETPDVDLYENDCYNKEHKNIV